MIRHDSQGGTRDDGDEVFNRQYQVYKESSKQRGESEQEAEETAAEKLKTPAGEPGGAHRDRD